MPDVSLVIACYNEQELLEESVRELLSVMDATRFSYELIFVDDGSRDGTREIISDLVGKNPERMRKIFNKRNLGRGGAVARGIRRSKGVFTGFLDIDLEVGAHYIPYCLNELTRGASVATAWRIYKLNLRGLIRHIASRFYSLLVGYMLKLPFHDTETGFKFFRTEDILPVLSEMKDRGWFWDTEIMARSYKHKLTIIERPCLFLRRHDKKSSVHLVRDSVRYFISLLKYHKELRAS